MSDASEKQYGTYRCPVCGHSDGVELDAGQERLLIQCSYCGTQLQVSPRGSDSVRFSTQVAREAASQ